MAGASEHYVVIIIGSGAGGAPSPTGSRRTGKKILLLERGDYVRASAENWTPERGGRGPATTSRRRGRQERQEFHAGAHYFVGGTQVLRRRAPPSARRTSARSATTAASRRRWPIGYDAPPRPYYTEAEHLYHVHGFAARIRPSRARAHPT